MKSNKKTFPKEFIEFYDNVNLLYTSIYPNYIEHNKLVANSIDEMFDFSKIKSFVDIGCGTSNLLFELSNKYPDINFFGVDFSPKTINYCKNKYNKNNLSYILGNWFDGIEKIKDIINEEIDFIVCLGNTVCHYKPDEQIYFITYIEESLSKNGVFVYDSYKGWNNLINSNDFKFEPKYLSKNKNGEIVHSAFFSKYSSDIAIRNIFITKYNEFNEPPLTSFHYRTWQYPIHKELEKYKINLKDSIGIFQYYKFVKK